MTDHEIHLTLARFMGWREMSCPTVAEIIEAARDRESRSFFEMSDPAVVLPGAGHWCPTTDPSQAVEVMAEVAKRGGLVETSVTGSEWEEPSSELYGRVMLAACEKTVAALSWWSRPEGRP